MPLLEKLLGSERAAAHLAEREARRARGEAVLGRRFDFSRDWERYLDSARVLLEHAKAVDRLDHFSKPIGYLQRHAVELILKSLLESLYGIEADQMELDELEGPRRQVPNTHDLERLHDLLAVVLPTLYLTVPPELTALVADMAKVEDGDETRWRFPKGARGNYRNKPSFPKETIVPATDWQERLNEIRERHLRVRMGHHEDRTLVETIGYEAEGITQAQLKAGLITFDDAESP